MNNIVTSTLTITYTLVVGVLILGAIGNLLMALSVAAIGFLLAILWNLRERRRSKGET